MKLQAKHVLGLCIQATPIPGSKRFTRQLLKLLGHTKPPEDFDLWEALFVWLADYLVAPVHLPLEHVLSFVEFVLPVVRTYGNALNNVEDSVMKPDSIPVCKVGLLDQRLVVVDGVDKFYDLEDETEIDYVQIQPVETRSWSLPRLYALYRFEYDRRLRSDTAVSNQKGENVSPRAPPEASQ